MLRISALTTAILLGISAQAALAGGFSFDLPRVDFVGPATVVSTSGPLAPVAQPAGN